jgi:glycosyltransferase involved in cell wall biosynthesis
MASPVVTKLASLGIDAVRDHGADVVFSFYAEPFAVAGHLIAEACGLPHVIKVAGSDSGRLWRHPQFTALYDHVFRSATFVIAGSAVPERMQAIGVASDRVRVMRAYTIDGEIFRPEGPVLDIADLLATARDDPEFAPLCNGEMRDDLAYIGVYGKLWPNKGTEQLLRAFGRLKEFDCEMGLLQMGHARPRVAQRYRQLAEDLGITDRIVQIPFLPNWRVPEFIRRCFAICYLEQDFPITYHAPTVAREVLACGKCLIASTEIARKLPFRDRVVSGYNIVAINDVDDVEELAAKLAAMAARPELAPEVGARGRRLLLDFQRSEPFPEEFEKILEDAVALGRLPAGALAASSDRDTPVDPQPSREPAADSTETRADALFRLELQDWALAESEVATSVPGLTTRILSAAKDKDEPIKSLRVNDAQLVVDSVGAEVLALCDGSRTVADIAAAVENGGDAGHREAVETFIIELFEAGLVSLRTERASPIRGSEKAERHRGIGET